MRTLKMRAATVAVALLAGMLTAGCTPKPLGMAGVYLDGGLPTVLLRPCPGIAVTQVWVYDRAADRRWGTANSGQQAVPSVRLLAAPAGWSEPEVPAGKELSEFVPGTAYQVQVATNHPDRGGINMVEFTLADLTADKVWATRPHGSPQILTREQFDRSAADGC